MIAPGPGDGRKAITVVPIRNSFVCTGVLVSKGFGSVDCLLTNQRAGDEVIERELDLLRNVQSTKRVTMEWNEKRGNERGSADM